MSFTFCYTLVEGNSSSCYALAWYQVFGVAYILIFAVIPFLSGIRRGIKNKLEAGILPEEEDS